MLSKRGRPIEAGCHRSREAQALACIGERDPDDGPVPACALRPDCPASTENTDFFGTGVTTRITSRVKLYLVSEAS